MIHTLTSLRFFFALMVFGAHCYVIDPCFDVHVFKEGFVGVSFFFILSGFIIAYNYQRKMQEQKVTKRRFWVARVARIYPLHLLTLTLLALGSNAVDPMEWWEGVKHFVTAAFLLHPFVPKMDYFFYFNSPSWSLGCEQVFYFLFPFLALLFARRWRLAGVLVACAVVMPLWMSFTDEANILAYWYVNPLARFPDFLVGMFLFRVYERCRLKKISFSTASWLEVGALCIFILFYAAAGEWIPKVYRYSCYYWVPVSLVLLVFSLQKGFVSRLLSNKYLVMGGEISYSFYLIHTLMIFAYLQWVEVSGRPVSSCVAVPLVLFATIGLSLLSYYYFEKPANRWVKRILNKQQ